MRSPLFQINFVSLLRKQYGIQKGIQKGVIETALRMLKRRFSIDDISDVTGLSKEEIERLEEQSKQDN